MWQVAGKRERKQSEKRRTSVIGIFWLENRFFGFAAEKKWITWEITGMCFEAESKLQNLYQ